VSTHRVLWWTYSGTEVKNSLLWNFAFAVHIELYGVVFGPKPDLAFTLLVCVTYKVCGLYCNFVHLLSGIWINLFR